MRNSSIPAALLSIGLASASFCIAGSACGADTKVQTEEAGQSLSGQVPDAPRMDRNRPDMRWSAMGIYADVFPPPPPFARPPERPEATIGYKLAERLSVAETYLGISSAQQEAWRTYTNALITFTEMSVPKDDGREPGPFPPAEARQNGGHAPGPADEPLFDEALAVHAVAVAESAKALLASSKALKTVLTTDQLVRLRSIDRPLAPDDSEFAPPSPRPPFCGNDHD